MMHVPRLSCQRVTGSYQGPWVPGFGRSVPSWNRRCGIPSQQWGEETTYFWNLLPNKIPKKEESNIFHLQPQHHRNLSQKLTSSLQIETQYPPEKRKNEPSEGLLKSISAKCWPPLPSGNDCYIAIEAMALSKPCRNSGNLPIKNAWWIFPLRKL